MTEEELRSITGAELVEWLAERLKDEPRRRESMPCVDLRALDGTVVVATLRDHHWGGG